MNREEEKPEKEGKKENDYYTSQPSFGSKKTSRFWHQIRRDVRIFVVIAACDRCNVCVDRGAVQYDDTGTLPQYKRYDPYCAEPVESFYRENDRGDEYRSIDYWTDGRGGPQRSK